MDWFGSYTSTFRVERVDPVTWEQCGTLVNVDEIEIERDGTDKAPMIETASMKVTSDPLEPFESGWLRITIDAVQGNSSESEPVATLWFDSESGRYDKGFREDNLVGTSVLRQASGDVKIGDGAWASKGIDGSRWCADVLSEFIDAPVHIDDGGFELSESIVFDLDASVLEAVWSVLTPNGWIIRIDGRGEVHLCKKPSSESLVLDGAGSCSLIPGTEYGDGKSTYSREWAPDVGPFSVVRASVPEYGLDGLYRVMSQRLSCTHGIVVEECVEAMGDA